MPDGALGSRSRLMSEPSGYVQARPRTRSPGPWTEAAAIQAAKKDSADFGVFQLPTDQNAGSALRLRRGLHDQRQVWQS